MKQKTLFNRMDVGKAKGYQQVVTILKVLKSFGTKGNEVTAYEIAAFVDLSPQHVNRVLKKLFEEGRVDFKTFERGSKVGREWWLK